MPKSRFAFFFAALAAISLTLAAVPAQAQEKPGTVARVYFSTAKPGMTAEFEAGRKRHVAAHKAMGDTWTWQTFQVDTGENTGQYHVVTFGHHWKDFDAWEKKHADADGADAAKNLEPYTASGSNAFFTFMAGVSTAPVGTAPEPMAHLIHFHVKIGGEMEFNRAVSKIHEAIQKTKWGSPVRPASYQWYMMADGGSGPHYILALPMRGWADMEDPETPFPAMLEKAFGRAEAQSIFDAFDRTVKHQYSETVRYRPDLSYVPGK